MICAGEEWGGEKRTTSRHTVVALRKTMRIPVKLRGEKKTPHFKKTGEEKGQAPRAVLLKWGQGTPREYLSASSKKKR